jgi:hypothetical protein
MSSAKAGADPETIITEIERNSPELANAARLAVSRGGILSLIALLFSLLVSCSSNISQTLDWNEIVDQAHVYMTGADPYPLQGGTRTQGPAIDEPEQQISRQQRRHQERQSKKQQKHNTPARGSKNTPKQ